MSRRRAAWAALLAIGLVVASCGGAADADGEESDGTAVTTTTRAAATTTTKMTTTTRAPTTTTTTTTTIATTTRAPATTTTAAAASGNPLVVCVDCPDWATDEDRHYVASMRLVQSWYEENFITNMGAFDIIDMGQTICLGLDGSYDGSVDAALSAVMTIYSVPPGRQGFVAVSAVEQAIRVSCRSYESTWTIWAGTEPFDPFAES